MSQRPGPCRAFNTPEGCPYGVRCRFSHDRDRSASLSRGSPSRGSPSRGPPSRGSPSPASSPAHSRPQSPHPHRPHTPQKGSSGAPRNACQFFWSTGTCTRGFECSFRHIKHVVAPAVADKIDLDAPHPSELQDVDFFSTEGLTAGHGSAREDRHNLNPSEVHNHLKDFIGDNRRLETPSRIQGFVRILASVHDGNKSWNTENAQDFLEFVVKGDTLHRIGEILCFVPVKTSVGLQASKSALSFQTGYFPIFQFFASDLVLKSTLHSNINHLYSIIKDNHDGVFTTLRTCLSEMIVAKSWKGQSPKQRHSIQPQNNLDGLKVFRTLSVVLLQYFNRYKDAIRDHCTGVVEFIRNFADWFNVWSEDVSAPQPRFTDALAHATQNVRELSITHIREDIQRLQDIVQRESGNVQRHLSGPSVSSLIREQHSRALAGQLAQMYDPPGSLRPEGPRHDNDFVDICDIRSAPTHEELFSSVQPYLPVFRHDAPHHLPMNSMERHLDIQFRLLREDLISAIRSSMAAIQDDLQTIWNRPQNMYPVHKTTLEEVIERNGGAYRTTGRDSIFFQIYTNVEFLHHLPTTAPRRGVIVTLILDAPAVDFARDTDWYTRYNYWIHSKRLQGLGLVALIVVSNRAFKTYLGVICSFDKDIAESSKHSLNRIQIRVAFFDPDVELKALQGERLGNTSSSTAFLVDNSVMFESTRPFLERMKTIEPTLVPFASYIAHGDSIKDVAVMPPKYARVPAFRFKLQCLAQDGKLIDDLDVSNPEAVKRARQQLRTTSVLDPSQADAMVDTLTKEVSLIQGPPGTGKSFTAKEVLRVLLASKIRPIVLIAFTNHALDHMLTSVLDGKITDNVVRLGSRSTDERIMEYTLEKLEKVASASNLDRSFKRQYATVKTLEAQMTTIMTAIRSPFLHWDEIKQYLDSHHPKHANAFRVPPSWVAELYALMSAEEKQLGEWQDIKRRSTKTNTMVDSSVSHTLYGFWKAGKDVHVLQEWPPNNTPSAHQKVAASSEQYSEPQSMLTNCPAFLETLLYPETILVVPTLDRPLGDLLKHTSVWEMSPKERTRLAADWEQRCQMNLKMSRIDQYKSTRDQYNEACKNYNDMKDESHRRLLVQKDLIACTTTGAASLTSLLESVAPQVLLVEEAGQVLEAHILTSLVPSVRHLICIGDPQQLRPTLSTFTLSMDSERGSQLFRFDRSLMERLADNGFQMSQINVQRRMRPAISHFARTILYPKLEDNALVYQYPAVQGMQKDVFFYDHLNKEGGSEDSVSKYNIFEVKMIRDLVIYFLQQGMYNGPGDIAVLCAYLGQLQQVRAVLQDMKISVSIDERDAEALAQQGVEGQINFEEVVIGQHVRLGTVDIFQGQEAKIVIVSLVRNSGKRDTSSASIGFLKSSNRINVALSRAKHGLYIMGNAMNLRKNPTWSTVLNEMDNRDQIGPGFPIICPRHPGQTSFITQPGELPIVSPAGGCLLPCGFRMDCGHVCPSVCHSAPDDHRSIQCLSPCTRTLCTRDHPCPKRCSDDCGRCEFPVYKVVLPCGHIAGVLPCYQLERLALVQCTTLIQKPLPDCEHSVIMPCHLDPTSFRCREPCMSSMECCGHLCQARCSNCQVLNGATPKTEGGKVVRARHREIPHPCQRPMYCQHICGLQCTQEHDCNTSCKAPCRQRCLHHRCPRPCSEPCAPCMEPCIWSCAHLSCPVLCGSICSRLPCDEPCTSKLPCGHTCPSVCGEPCMNQRCIVCLRQSQKAAIVDFIMQRRLDEIDLESSDVSDRLIALACGHIFTVKTLDVHCGMSNYYEVDPMGRFLSTKSPPVNYQSPPVCPTCQGPIDALRYGRSTKRAALDILEQNVASTMSSDLVACSLAVSEFTSSLPTIQNQAKNLPVSTMTRDSDRRTPPWANDHGPLPVSALTHEAMKAIHGLALEEARAWSHTVRKVIYIYLRVVDIATTCGVHVKVYESALATLHRLAMQEIPGDSAQDTDVLEHLALMIVDNKIGQPPPKADIRFQIEAYFLSLDIRSLISQIARARVNGLSRTSTTAQDIMHRARWTTFVEFLYASCVADAKKARALASNSSATRQAVRASLLVICYEFEVFRWMMECRHASLAREGTLDEGARSQLSMEVRAHKSDMLQSLNIAHKEYISRRPSKTMDDLKEEMAWLDENWGRKVQAWQSECDVLELFLVEGGFYQPTSLQQSGAEIVKLFGAPHRGRFYNCENGHAFVTAECGDAMHASVCPECKASISGANDQLVQSNTHAKVF